MQKNIFKFISLGCFSFFILSISTLAFPHKILAASGTVTVGVSDYSKSFNRAKSFVTEKKQKVEKAVVGGRTKGSASQELYVFNSTDFIGFQIMTNVWGPDTSNLTVSEATEAKLVFGQGVIPAMSEYIAYMYQKPASTQAYIADIFKSAKIIPPAQAQGIGFGALDPILQTWKTFRNLAYLFFVLIFLVIGFMIMFRHKINGQTVVTVQQAIPNIIVALLFVTFSYAIGGLLIDAMYLMMYLIIGLFGGSASLINKNFLELGLELVKTGGLESASLANNTIKEIMNVAVVENVIGWIGSLTVGIIVSLAVLFGVFNLFWELVKSYIAIVLNVAFSPMILMLGAIPGQDTFKKWFQSLVGNLAAFPTVLLLLVVKSMITNYSIQGGGFMPPFLVGQGVGGAMPAIVGVGMLLVIPEVVKKVKDALGAKGGVFEELGGIAGGKFAKASKIGMPVGFGISGGVMGGGIGAGGGLIKGILNQESGEALRKRVGRSTLAGIQRGGVSGAMLPMVPGLTKEVGSRVWKQGLDYASSETYGQALRKLNTKFDVRVLRDLQARYDREGALKGSVQTRTRSSGPTAKEGKDNQNKDNYGG